jgi:molybdopterin synthase sulfur carrier subunit
MSVRVLFLGPLSDLAGEVEMEFPAPLDWAGLLNALPKPLAEEIGKAHINAACAGKVLPDKTALRAEDGDEVALLPPVSGG